MANINPQPLICEHAQIMICPTDDNVMCTGKLVANTAVSINIPDNAKYVVFDRDNIAYKFFAKINDTATVPSTLNNTGDSSVANPREWALRGLPATGNYISIISEDADLIVTCTFATGLTTGSTTDRTVGY